MKRVFADTHFFIALLNGRDEAHARAVRIESGPKLHLVTTRWVLAEVADAMASPAYRARAAKFLVLAKANPWLTILKGRLPDRHPSRPAGQRRWRGDHRRLRGKVIERP